MSVILLESRVERLETMLSGIDKKMLNMIKQHIASLETRTLTLIDSKVDVTDYYLKLKSKVEKDDFESILKQILIMKQSFSEVIESNKEMKKEFKVTQDKCEKNIKELKSVINKSKIDANDKIDKLETKVKANENKPIPQYVSDTINSTFDSIKKINDRLNLCEESMKSACDIETNSKALVLFKI